MMTKQQGFSLLELMIVIAIIGILAAIAIPAYQDYSTRAKITEGISLSASAKTAVGESFHATGSFPADNAAAGMGAKGDIKGKYVKSVEVGTNGVITVTYNKVGPVADDSTLVLTPTDNSGSISWACTSAIADRYLPAECR